MNPIQMYCAGSKNPLNALLAKKSQTNFINYLGKSRFADHTDRICFFLHKGFSIKILISSQMLVWALMCRQVFWMFIYLYFFLALPQSISFLHIIFASKLNFRESFLKQNLRDNHSFLTLYNLFIFISLILQVIL